MERQQGVYYVMSRPEEHTHLAIRPDRAPQDCDVLLVLDDRTALPAHSKVLAQHSKLFADMFALTNAEALSGASAAAKLVLPFGGCSREAAIEFLSMVYSLPSKREPSLFSETVLPVAELGHNFDIKEVLDLCDDAILKWESSNPLPNSSSAAAANDFFDREEVLDAAVRLGMPKLLACCERRSASKGFPNWHRFPVSSRLRLYKARMRAADSDPWEDEWECQIDNHCGNAFGLTGQPAGLTLTARIPSAQDFLSMARPHRNTAVECC